MASRSVSNVGDFKLPLPRHPDVIIGARNERRRPLGFYAKSRRLWSLWEMLELHAADFMGIIVNHRTLFMKVVGTAGPLTPRQVREVKTYAADIRRFCDSLHLTITSGLAEWIARATTMQESQIAMDTVERAIQMEEAPIASSRTICSRKACSAHSHRRTKTFARRVIASHLTADRVRHASDANCGGRTRGAGWRPRCR
jgi:hypothetical protein